MGTDRRWLVWFRAFGLPIMRPRTIFGAIVVWLIATVGLSVLGFVATSFLLSARWTRPDGFMHRFQQLQLGEARVALEEGGPAKLADYLHRLDRTLGARHLLVDSDNRSVVDGEDCSGLLQRGGRPFWSPIGRPPSITMRVPSIDGRYQLLIDAPPPPVGPWDFLRNFLWLPVLVAVSCYLLAIHIAVPLRKLTLAVERFGLGDLTARVGVAVSRQDEVGELARAFDAMAERTQTLMAAERRLLQDVSHELRSPLARLGFGVELARTSADRETALARVKKDLARLGTLVDELIQLTRSEGDPGERNLSEVDLTDLLHDLIDDCSVEAEARDCRLDLRVDSGDTVVVSGEPELLRRACENVIRNAIRHAERGTAIDVVLNQRNGLAAIDVRDRGSGVPEPDLERIFQPFYRVEEHRDRNSGGVGLGLAIARRALNLHGGSVTATNADPGLCVHLEIPASLRNSPS